MNMFTSKSVIIGFCFLLVFASGFWLTRGGKPYGMLLLNVHKLIALGAVIFLGVTVHRVSQAAPLQPLQILVVVITGLLFIGTFVTGGLLSVDKEFPAIVRSLHHLTPYLTVLSSAAALYLLLASSSPIPAG